jgi:uracil permease
MAEQVVWTSPHYAPDDAIAAAQLGIVLSGLISIAVGFIIRRFGQKSVEKVLPATVTGSIAMVIGITLAGNAMKDFTNLPANVTDANATLATNLAFVICLVTLLATILFSVYLKKGVLGQLPILFGLLTGYLLSLILGWVTGINFVDFAKEGITPVVDALTGKVTIIDLPHFTFPWQANPAYIGTAILAIMPIAIATIPESTAHIYQLDIYVNNLAKQKGKEEYKIANMLGQNLIGDGLGDIISGFVGGPAGTNYGENISTMAITKNYSVWVLIGASIITMVISFFTPLTVAVYSIPNAVIGGLSIYLFGIIAAQGITIMVNKKVDLFDAKNLAVIATIMIIGIGGHYAFGGSIPIFGIELPAIATAAIFGILLNLLLSIKGGKKKGKAAEEAVETKPDGSDEQTF